MADLSDVQRRVLGNLPAYRSADSHAAAATDAVKAGAIATADAWPSTRTVADVTVRVAKDPYAPLNKEAAVLEVLEDLRALGFVAVRGQQWNMTRAGLDALVS